MIRAAMLDGYSYVENVIALASEIDLTIIPGLIWDVESVARIGDFWTGEVFIHSDDPQYPPHP